MTGVRWGRRPPRGRRPTIGAVSSTFPRLPGPVSIARRSRWVGLVVFAVFVAIGLASRAGSDLAGALGGAALALAGAIPLFLVRSRLALAAAAVAAAGVVLAGNADSRAIVWFASWWLAGAIRRRGRCGAVYWFGVAFFGGEWLWAIRDPGWAPWTAGVTVSVLAVSLVRHQFVLVDGSAPPRPSWPSVPDRRTNRIVREIHDVIAHSLTVSLLHVTAPDSLSRRPGRRGPRVGRSRAPGPPQPRRGPGHHGTSRASMSDTVSRHRPPAPPRSPSWSAVPPGRRDVTSGRRRRPFHAPDDGGVHSLPHCQEALTNAAKHAPGAPLTLEVAATATRRRCVESAGPPRKARGWA